MRSHAGGASGGNGGFGSRGAAKGGHLGYDADRLPLVGPVPGWDGVWIAGGYSGHGNALGFACGDLVARAVLGETLEELRLFDPARLAGVA